METTVIRTTQHNSWTDAPGYQPCGMCKGIGALIVPYVPRPGQHAMFAPEDNMTVSAPCSNPTCESGRVKLRPDCPTCDHVFEPREQRYAGLCRSCASEKFAS